MDMRCVRALMGTVVLGISCMDAPTVCSAAQAGVDPPSKQGWAPGDLGLAISRDGRTAYVSFALDDALLVVDLETMTIRESIDVSPAGGQLVSVHALLSIDGRSLYVANFAAENVMVVDTATNRVTAVLPLRPLFATAMSASADGRTIYVPSNDGSLYSVSTADQSYARLFIPGVIVGPIAASNKTPGVVYTAGRLRGATGFESSVFAINVTTGAVVRSGRLPTNVIPTETGSRRLVLSQDETIAYLGWLGPGPNNKGVGNLVVFDLNNYRVMAAEPAECGVADFVVHEASAKIYVIGFWSGSGSTNAVPVFEFDLSTNRFVRSIPLSPSSDMRAIASDPVNPDFLYETDGDHNFLRKVQISTGQEVGRVQFNRALFRPGEIIRAGGTGYILGRGGTRSIFKLDLGSGQLLGRVTLPVSFSGGGFYQDRLYFKSGGQIIAVNPSDGSIVQSYPLAISFQPTSFTFFGDRMATIHYLGANQLLVFDARTMAILKMMPLPGELYAHKVVASPDGSKLYLARGPASDEKTVITIISGSTLDVLNTIEIPPADQRYGNTSFLEGEFDEVKRTLYLTGFSSVYKIDMDTDKLLGTLDLIDIFAAWGRRGWTPTGLSGISLSPSKDKLYVTSGDAHLLYWYDFTAAAWSTRTTNVKGYFLTDGVASPDRRYFFTTNGYSDTVSMLDLTSGELVKVIPIPALRKAAW